MWLNFGRVRTCALWTWTVCTQICDGDVSHIRVAGQTRGRSRRRTSGTTPDARRHEATSRGFAHVEAVPFELRSVVVRHSARVGLLATVALLPLAAGHRSRCQPDSVLRPQVLIRLGHVKCANARALGGSRPGLHAGLVALLAEARRIWALGLRLAAAGRGCPRGGTHWRKRCRAAHRRAVAPLAADAAPKAPESQRRICDSATQGGPRGPGAFGVCCSRTSTPPGTRQHASSCPARARPQSASYGRRPASAVAWAGPWLIPSRLAQCSKISQWRSSTGLVKILGTARVSWRGDPGDGRRRKAEWCSG